MQLVSRLFQVVVGLHVVMSCVGSYRLVFDCAILGEYFLFSETDFPSFPLLSAKLSQDKVFKMTITCPGDETTHHDKIQSLHDKCENNPDKVFLVNDVNDLYGIVGLSIQKIGANKGQLVFNLKGVVYKGLKLSGVEPQTKLNAEVNTSAENCKSQMQSP